MFKEIGKVLKTLLWAIVLMCLVKVYENSGFSNPTTLAVLCLIFSLWILFRIELNEDVSEEESRNGAYEAPSSPNSTIFTPTTSSHRHLRPEDLTDDDKKKGKRKLSKYTRLVRSRSNTPTKTTTCKSMKV
jgi:hypothetical protein